MRINEWLIKRQHDKFIKELYQDKYDFFFNVSNKILNNPNEAEDAVSEGFIKIINNIEKIFEISCHERLPYCVKIMKNCSYDIIKKRKEFFNDPDLITQTKSETEDVLEEIIAKQSIEELKSMISELSNLEIVIIKERYFKNKSFKEIAIILGMKEATVRKKHERILKKLREIYERKGDN